MKIPSVRTRRDMEMAAELRAAGATFPTIAHELGRQTTVVERWVRVYPREWEELLAAAEARLSRDANNESRSALRAMLRHKSARVRLQAAEKIVRQRAADRARAATPDANTSLSALMAHLEEFTDDELDHYLSEFVRRTTERDGAPRPGDAVPPAGEPGSAGAD